MNREPAVAGSFYPAHPGKLQTMLKNLLNQVVSPPPAPKAMIVPHAGYIYSGQVAASAYARLHDKRETIQRVVLLGPTHRVAVRGLASVSVDSFSTPLGDIAVDKAALQQVASLPQVVISDEAHAQEHSLEVHLPFLQTCLTDFTLVPFAVGDTTPAEVAQILETLWGGDETLIIISSDLSHFLDYDSARARDRKTSNNIVNLRYEKLSCEDACGCNPVSGLLYLARQHGYGMEMIDLCNSGDTAGPKDRVVGYGAYALSTDNPSAPSIPDSRYTPDEGQQLLQLARQSIEYGLQHGKALTVIATHYDPALQKIRASFVTLHRHQRLRGCIGTLKAHRPLVQDIAENACAAAFRDPRFAPLKPEELNSLDIHISILTPAIPMAFTSEEDLLSRLQPGIDGLILEDQGHRGTFLPTVWDSLKTAESFWQQLKHKAGLPANHWSDTLKVSRYQTQVFP